MNLFVETGEASSESNVYISNDDAKAMAKARGLELPCTNEEVRALNLRATDYFETFSHSFSGHRLTSTQGLSWPRYCANIDGVEILETQIPKEIPLCIMLLMVSLHKGIDPAQVNNGEPYVIRESIDTLRIDYSEKGQGRRPLIPMVNSLINKLSNRAGAITFSKA